VTGPSELSSGTDPATSALRERRDRALGLGAELFYDDPVEIVRGEGVHLFDRAGRRYLDLYNNVPCVGHGNAAVVEAMATQQATLNIHNRYLHEGIVTFAERLIDLHHEGIESVVFSCTGTEANEVALRMAQEFTGCRGIVCTASAYHGSSGLVDRLTYLGEDVPETAAIQTFPHPDLYRPLRSGLDLEALTEAYLGTVTSAIERLNNAGHGFAALIVCPIFANEGLPRLPVAFMARLTQIVHAAGGLLIADEVQSGYGRTGDWWSYRQDAYRPDIVVSGKPMGNGLPLAATAASRLCVDAFRAATGYFNTFASTPLQAAVGMAVLDEIERLGLCRNAAETGAWLLSEIERVCADHPRVGDVRGRGLFLGMEMVQDPISRSASPATARALANAMRERGFLLSNAGAHDNVIKIRPPLVFSRADAQETVDALSASLAHLRA